MSVLLPVVARETCQERLNILFPRGAFDSSMSNLLAATAVSGMIYIGAVTDDDRDEMTDESRFVRPTSVFWLNDEVYQYRISDTDRNAWWNADRTASTARRKTLDLLNTWGISTNHWYENNNREGLRDETFRHWMTQGAILERVDLDTTSSHGRWILRRSFADLFNPDLTGEALTTAIETWTQNNMSTAGKLKATLARQRSRDATSIEIRLPDGSRRSMTPGNSSLLLQGVIEVWAQLRLEDPMVLTISQSGEKILLTDEARLSEIGIRINVSDLLPDALLVDLRRDDMQVWIVEAVATDGPITEERKVKFLRWAEQQGIDPSSCRFLTAFLSRNDPAAKRHLKHLASGTFAWFLDEPDYELSWNEIDATSPNNIISIVKN